MSIHISAKPGEIADKILLPGDPLRAKFIAENFLASVSRGIRFPVSHLDTVISEQPIR